jgi:hypothetical protein
MKIELPPVSTKLLYASLSNPLLNNQSKILMMVSLLLDVVSKCEVKCMQKVNENIQKVREIDDKLSEEDFKILEISRRTWHAQEFKTKEANKFLKEHPSTSFLV